MAYQHDKSPGGSTQSPIGTYDEGIEAVTYQHGQYPEHYIPGQESPQVYHGQPTYPAVTDTKNDFTTSTPGTNATGSRVLGMKRKVFWILVGLLVLLLVLVVGLGAGLGVVAQSHSGYGTFFTYLFILVGILWTNGKFLGLHQVVPPRQLPLQHQVARLLCQPVPTQRPHQPQLQLFPAHHKSKSTVHSSSTRMRDNLPPHVNQKLTPLSLFLSASASTQPQHP